MATVGNIMSLKLASEMSLTLVEQTYPGDLKLLYYFGCLPGGLTQI